MFKTIIVDDEVQIRDAILEFINFKDLGFDVVGFAENGLEGLELAMELKPDLVITDVRMPFMDGLEMAKKIKEFLPTCDFVVISGYDEFIYAKKAMDIQITEYVLKPLTAKELCAVMEKVKARLDENLNQKRDLKRLNEALLESLPMLKEHLLSSLLEGTLSKTKIDELATIANINLNGDAYMVAIISPHTKVDNISNGHLSKHQRLVKIALLDMCKDVLAKTCNMQSFYYRDEVSLLFIFKENQNANTILNLLEGLKHAILSTLDIEVSIGVGHVVNDIVRVPESAKTALTSLDYTSILGFGNVIWIDNLENAKMSHLYLDINMLQELSAAIRACDEAKANSIITKLILYAKNNDVPMRAAQVYLLEILTSLLINATELGMSMDEVFPLKQWNFSDMFKFQNISEKENLLINLCSRIIQKNRLVNIDPGQRMVMDAQVYIKKKYDQQNLTADVVSNYLHISTSYFSFLFKKHSGETFHQALNAIRMQRAMELLKNTNLKTSDIAKKIGLSEASYFSYSFKKYYNISPSSIRKESK